MVINFIKFNIMISLAAMDKRYPNEPWEIGKFREKVNQKCRDAARKLRQKKDVDAKKEDDTSSLDEDKDN